MRAPGLHVQRQTNAKTSIDASSYVIVAEDDVELRRLLSAAIQRAGLEVIECAHGVELLNALEELLKGEKMPGLRAIVTDVRMPGITGMSILEGLHDMSIQVPIFVITAFGGLELHQRALSLGVTRTFDKPFDIDELVREVVSRVPEEKDAR